MVRAVEEGWGVIGVVVGGGGRSEVGRLLKNTVVEYGVLYGIGPD